LVVDKPALEALPDNAAFVEHQGAVTRAQHAGLFARRS
jgi:hypothetical protein